ncbi:MAG: hypothetical protein ACFB0E_21880 [Leptolyngbyaceae cyanobacterium]
MKTYQSHLPSSVYLGFAGAYLLFQGGVFWFFISRDNFLRNNLLMLPVGLVFLGSLYYFSFTSKLQVDAEGFEWQRGRAHLRSAWANVSHLGSRNEGDATTYGLYLKTPMPTQLDPKGLLPKFLIDPKIMDYVPLSGIVPLLIRAAEIGERALRQTPFGQDLVRRAPHVFQDAG